MAEAAAAPAKATAKASAGEELIPEPARGAMRAMLLACADTKLLLGYHYGEWTFGAPALEAAIAACSMGQDELGHARLLQGLLDHFFGLKQDTLVEERAASQFANVAFLDHPFASWADLVAANALVDLAITLEIAAYRGSSLGALRRVVDKMLQEEAFHDQHGRGWFVLAAGRDDESHEAVARATRSALPHVLSFFGPPGSDYDAPLLEAGVKTRAHDEVRKDFVERLRLLGGEAGFGDAGLAAGGTLWGDADALDWGAWDPARRRLGGAGPDEELLQHLSGSKNVEFRRT